RAAEHFDEFEAREITKIELDWLHKTGKIRDHENALILVVPNESEHAPIFRREELQRATSKRFRSLALRQNAARPPEQGISVVLLRLHVYRFVLIFGIDDHRQMQLLRIGMREARISIG